jgi:predicted PurR-regulated permease PerM
VNLRPDHLYKAVGLFFLLAFLYRFFDGIAQVLLLAYAASIVAVALNALVQHVPFKRTWVAALVGLGFFVTVGVILWFGVPALLQQIRNLAQRGPEFIAQFESWGEWLRNATGLNIQLVGDQTTETLRRVFSGMAGQDMLVRARGLLEILFIPLIILFGGLFAVASPNERLMSPLLRAVPRDRRLAFRRMFDLLGDRLLGWLKGTLIAMLGVALLSLVAFYVIGVPNALLLAIFSGVVEFIPLAGPWIGGVVATLIALMDDPMKGLWTALAALVIQQVEANLITPWAMSRAAEIHPFITLFSLVIFGTIFGFLGILLAIPLVILVWTVVQVLWIERAIDTDRDPIEPIVEE